MSKGSLVKLSSKGAEARLASPVPLLTNLEILLMGSTGEEIPGTLYAKVVEVLPERSTDFSVRFTSMSPQIETFLYSLLGQCTPGSSE